MITVDLCVFTKKISDRQLEQLCAHNPEARFETTPQGKLIIMPPTGSESGRKNSSLLAQVWYWNHQNKLGEVFDSSTGFKLSNGAVRSPDVSWISKERWNSLSHEQQKRFAPIDPDFVIELLSPTDDLNQLQKKMQEYIECGVRLGWLINPEEKQVEIYRSNRQKETLNSPNCLYGEDILPDLTVILAEIF